MILNKIGVYEHITLFKKISPQGGILQGLLIVHSHPKINYNLQI
jgi:hypothetical protein